MVKVKLENGQESAFADGKDIPNDVAPSLFVEAGQEIEAGTPLGLAGNTGAVMPQGKGDGTHLHYGVVEVDPIKNLNLGKLSKDDISKVQNDFNQAMAGKIWNNQTQEHVLVNANKSISENISMATESFLVNNGKYTYIDP